MLRYIIGFLGLGLLLAASDGRGAGQSGGSVSISTNRATYGPNDAMAVTVRNGLSTPIYAMDTLASCSILALQYQANGAWQPSQVAQCPQKRPTRQVKIDAGGTYTASITAGYPGIRQLPFPTGSYRLVLTYSTSPDALPSIELRSGTIQVR
jgi:hypothetical protein